MLRCAPPAALLALMLLPAPARAQGPIPDPVLPSGLAVSIEDVVQVPPSSVFRPLARLNLLIPAPDGSSRLYVNDMRGKIYVIEDGVVRNEPFLDVAAALGDDFDDVGLQVGVSTFAFHPDFARPGAPGYGLFYTAHSEHPDGAMPDFPSPRPGVTHHDVLAEWRVAPDEPLRIDPASRREILRIAEPTRDHNMGQIGFDPNARRHDPGYGLLYIAMGDGGHDPGTVDPSRTGQDLGNPFGTILRIDPLGASHPDRPTNGRYGIPPDNPFVGDPGALDEIWAYGLRNPHRFTWDRGGRESMLISDIGQSNVEEVDLGVRGANYGWSDREGTFALDRADPTQVLPLPPDDAALGFTYPVAQYDHDEGFAIVGAHVYRGRGIPQLRGHYVFGDIRNGRLFCVPVADFDPGRPVPVQELTLRNDGVVTTLIELLGGAFRADLRFGFDTAGEIYVLSKRDGVVRRLVSELPARIDVRPRSRNDRIAPFSHGWVRVALFGSDALDVAEVDLATLAFGPAGAPPSHRNGVHFADLDRDGYTDLVGRFRIRRTGIAPGDPDACLTGQTLDGLYFGACDDVRTLPAPRPGWRGLLGKSIPTSWR